MSNRGLDRRSFFKQSLALLGSGGVLGSALGGLTAFWPDRAEAKPGGHRSVVSHCQASFSVDHPAFKGDLSLYLGGGGYASFDNAYDYKGFDSRQVLSVSTLSMEWEFDRKYAGNHPELGLVECNTLVRDKSNTRSGIIFMSQQEGRLFPATMINTLFVELNFPALGLRLFNREPIVLRGISRNLTAADIAKDPRVRRDPRGVPASLKAVLAGKESVEFEPVGTHTLQEKGVEFYDRADPERRVAVLLESLVQVFPHYGIDVRLVESKLSPRVVEMVWEIRNLVFRPEAGDPPEIVWYLGDSHNFEIVSQKQGLVRLGADPYRIEVTAINRHPTKLLISGVGGQPVLDKGCLFCGAQNAPKTSDTLDFLSGFAYTDVFELRARA